MKVTKTLKYIEGKGTCLVFEAVPEIAESDEPALCECGGHYVGAPCSK